MTLTPSEYVNPLIDTANRRFFFFSSACRPFGMVNLSPDTVNGGAWGSGYRYDHETVLWFSHLHGWQLAGIPVLPTTGPVKGHLGADAYKSAFSHQRETVRPGYHAVFLEDYGIQAELTATTRVGFHRYTFPAAETGDEANQSPLLYNEVDMEEGQGDEANQSPLLYNEVDMEKGLGDEANRSPLLYNEVDMEKGQGDEANQSPLLYNEVDMEEGQGDEANQSPTILFDLGAEVGPSEMSDCHIEQINPRELAGYVENAPTIRRPKPVRIYFVIHFDHDFTTLGGWRDGELLGEVTKLSGPGIGAYVQFAPNQPTPNQPTPDQPTLDHQTPNQPIQMKVALSYCSVEEARNNLNHELPHWDFDQVRAEADDEWNAWLGRIKVTGGSEAQRVKFYTDLYHAILGRRRVSDVSGTYIDNTGEEPTIRQIPLDDQGQPLYEHHNSDAFWGAQWTLNVLWPLAYPDITHNFCNTFVDMYKNGGLIPRGPSGGNYTFVMVAPTSTPMLVSAYQKGIRSFDVEAAYAGMVKNHGPGGLMSKAGYEHHTAIGGGVEYYLERGYVPHGIEAKAMHTKGGTQTLEYAYCDWALSQIGQLLGKEDAETFRQRGFNYRSLFDPDCVIDGERGFMRPRDMDGSWLADFDPMSPEGWVEANGWQNLWHAPHDVAGLIALFGGRKNFVRRLDQVLEKASLADFIAPHDQHHTNYLDYGNQPSTFVAHLFNYAGAPWLAQKWVRRIMEQAKSDITPYGGYGGDEDQGQMGALNVLMAMGLFSVNGGCNSEPFYEITTPLFDSVVIQLDSDYYSGQTFTIITENNAPENVYIQSATLNGQPLERPWFYHSELAAGGELRLIVGPEPNKAWGSREEDAPPSMSTPVE